MRNLFIIDYLCTIQTNNLFLYTNQTMNLASYLKALLSNLIDDYKKLLVRTSGLTLAFTIVCFLIVALLLRYSDFDPSSYKKQLSLLSYFYTSYSTGETYSIVDLTTIVFLFFASLVSIALLRSDANDNKEFEIFKSVKRIKLNDFLWLGSVFFVSGLFDYLLFRLNNLINDGVENKELAKWMYNFLMYPCRGFIPWMLFSLSIYKVTADVKLNWTFKKVCFVFIAFWIINAFSYELSVYIRVYVLDLLVIPVDLERKFVFESILGIGLIAFNFVGYYSVMTTSLRLLEPGKQEITQ